MTHIVILSLLLKIILCTKYWSGQGVLGLRVLLQLEQIRKIGHATGHCLSPIKIFITLQDFTPVMWIKIGENKWSIFRLIGIMPTPVSFGEIGLDYFRLPNDKSKSNDIIKRQQDCLCAQLDMAKALDCPIIIHSRNSFEDCVKFIDQSRVDWQKVVFHCFSEGINQLMELIKRGGRASFTGNITYIKNSKVLEAIKAQGIETLMIETDSPYLSPEPNRKSINEPSRIHDILEFISSLIDYDYDDLRDTVHCNSRRFYNLSMSSNS